MKHSEEKTSMDRNESKNRSKNAIVNAEIEIEIDTKYCRRSLRLLETGIEDKRT